MFHFYKIIGGLIAIRQSVYCCTRNRHSKPVGSCWWKFRSGIIYFRSYHCNLSVFGKARLIQKRCYWKELHSFVKSFRQHCNVSASWTGKTATRSNHTSCGSLLKNGKAVHLVAAVAQRFQWKSFTDLIKYPSNEVCRKFSAQARLSHRFSSKLASWSNKCIQNQGRKSQ